MVLMSNRRTLAQSGMTMIELLVALAIVAILIVALYFLSQTQLTRSRDARRKADLEKIKVVFEDYYNDNNCYPAGNVLLTCNGNQLQPYLDKVPCDPDGDPYLYRPMANQCAGYQLYTRLEQPNDPSIEQVSCTGPDGCGVGTGFEAYNYGVAAGTVVSNTGGGAGASPTPSGPPTGVYVCVPVCNVATQDYADNCEVTFTNATCNSACGDPANWCEYAITGGSGGGQG